VKYTTKIMSRHGDLSLVCSIPTRGELSSIVNIIRQICGFLWVLQFPPPRKITTAV